MEIKAITAAGAYDQVLRATMRAPKADSRLGPVRELLGVEVVITDPTRELIRCKPRKFNYRYMLMETMWHLCNRNDLMPLAQINPGIAKYVEDQRIGDWNSVAWAYGPHVNPGMADVMRILPNYPDTRRAVIEIPPVPSGSMAEGTPPCPSLLQYVIRNHELHAFTYMRSNDAYMGFPYDLFMFLTWQQALANTLCIKVGTYHHYVASLHLYEQHRRRAEEVVKHGCSADSLRWFPEMYDIIHDNTVNQAITAIGAAQGVVPGAQGSWSDAFMALLGCWDTMDPVLQEIKKAGEGVGWKVPR